ncbi:fucose isomerase [Anaerolentibacter hominis]|uniref:L-fucose/L-arabinose isomerase family protein n=1 Tax=Anaerolentibacter hominis TaxID=3079009 RepID=UPI0031B8499F
MDKRNAIKLGVVPTRRNLSGEFFCNLDVAQKGKKDTEAKLREMGIDFVNIDFLNDEGLIYSGLDAQKVADYMLANNVDAIFAPHVNFGTEDAIAKVGKLVGKPLLLWAPRDPSPDEYGNRCTDSQCGLMATGKILRQFGVPYTYMTNCTFDDPTFERTMNTFLGAVSVVRAMTNLRIGQIGTRPEPFWSVKCNELQLLEQFGIEVVPITMIEMQQRFDDYLNNRKEELEPVVQHYRDDFDVQVGEEYLYRVAALKCAIKSWAEEMQVSAIASSCWDAMRSMTGIASCFTFSELTDEHLPVICECDIHGAITSVIAQAATRWTKASFFADITIRHPENDNAELFWHCGVFPRSTASSKKKPQIGCNFDENRPAVGNFLIEDSAVTVVRFDCSDDKYSLLVAEGKTVPGPATKGTYGWIEFKDWPKLEHKVVTGPYIHHVAGVHASIAPIVYEACKYIPALTPDMAEPTEEEVQAMLR